jgi:chemotaxis protein methyltransferase CheR
MNHRDGTEAVVDKVAELLDLRIGLRTDPSLRARLRRCVCDEAATHGQGMETYLETLAKPGHALRRLVDRVTVQETAFFRHPEHFEILARDLLPALRQPVTIWSAACANGQEAFSLAMVLDEQGIDGSVIATDLAEAAVRRASASQYHARELTGLSSARLARYLTATDGSWQINKGLRDRVTVFQHNLLDPVPHRLSTCHIVFCRNVLIYFSPRHSRIFLERLADTLPAGASVFLGSAETVWQVTDRFEAVKIGNSFVHRRRRDHAPTVEAPARPTATAPAHVLDGTFPRRQKALPAPDRPVVADHSTQAALLAHIGQQALAVGDNRAAVTAFRKWAYLTPADTMAHLHLGLALEAADDQMSARRAYGVARRTMLAADPALAEPEIEGYSPDQLRRFLATKNQEGKP